MAAKKRKRTQKGGGEVFFAHFEPFCGEVVVLQVIDALADGAGNDGW